MKITRHFKTLCVLFMFTFSTQGLTQNAQESFTTTAGVAKPEPQSWVWQKVSEGTATWFFMDIYNATLFSNKAKLPTNFLADNVPLKLKLCYLKAITPDIFIEGANAKLPEKLSPALKNEVQSLHDAYKAVKPGDCYELEYTPVQGTVLNLNGKTLFRSQVPNFKRLYFGIWLGGNPLSDSLKQSLVPEN